MIAREFSRINIVVTKSPDNLRWLERGEGRHSVRHQSDRGMCAWMKVRGPVNSASPLQRVGMRCTEASGVDNAERLKRLILSAGRNSLETPGESRIRDPNARLIHVRGISFVIYRGTIFMKPEGDFYEKRGR